jgi:hypothetical protein
MIPETLFLLIFGIGHGMASFSLRLPVAASTLLQRKTVSITVAGAARLAIALNFDTNVCFRTRRRVPSPSTALSLNDVSWRARVWILCRS